MRMERVNRFVRVCIKLDELRFAGTIDWDGLAKNIFHNPRLTASDRVFLFWLCSMIDQFYQYTRIWTVGEAAMLKIIESRPRDLSDLRGIIVDGKIIWIGDERFILVRDDLKRIENTFKFLFGYSEIEGDPSIKFVHFLGELIDRLGGAGGTLRFGYYVNKHLWQGEKYESIDVNLSERELKRFLKSSRKRLWMFIMFLRRDPSIMRIFRDALIEVYGQVGGNQLYNIWVDEEKFSTKELELPSDMWNQRLFDALLREVIEGKVNEAKKVARELAKEYNISPTVFDVTFELGANICVKQECSKCPFGDNQLCSRAEGEICPLTNWLYPYYRKDTSAPELLCKPQNCPIGQDLGKNLCTREIDKTITH